MYVQVTSLKIMTAKNFLSYIEKNNSIKHCINISIFYYDFLYLTLVSGLLMMDLSQF